MSTEDDLRTIALSLPQTVEQPSWGMPTFKVRGKWFAVLNPKHGPGVRISLEEREELIAAEPAKFHATDHDGRYGIVRLHLDAIDPDELRELLTDGWRAAAGPKLAAEHPPA